MSSIQIMFDDFVIKKKMQKIIQLEEQENPLKKRCTKCSELQFRSEFTKDIKGLQWKCVECDRKVHRTYHNTIQGTLMSSFCSARTRAEKFFTNKTSKIGEVMFTLTMEELEQIYIDQEGKCFWMSPITNSKWKMSIDRLDQRFGYHKWNIVSCCLEFNVRKQWSWKKIQEMMLIKQSNQFVFNNENFMDSLKLRPFSKNLCHLPEHKAYIIKYATYTACTICR